VTADDLPLPTLLSRLLIAFTIEFDNEAEHRLEHRTTRGAAGGTGRGPWLVSQAMWANFMQFVGGDGYRCTRLTTSPASPTWPACSGGATSRSGRPRGWAAVLHRGGWPDGS
jgi:hypothetical protein